MELNSNKSKNLVFEVQLSGISSKDLNGFFRINIDGVEYGFPAQISESSISVDIPSLRTIVNRTLREGEKFKAKLELVGNENYMKPWDDDITIKSSVMVEAKLVEKSSRPTVKLVEDKKSEPVKKEKKLIKESKPIIKKKNIAVTKEHLIKYMEKHGTKNPKIQEVMLENCMTKVGDDNKKIFEELYKYYKKDKEK